MSDNSVPITPITRKLTLGDRIRDVADQLRQENGVQIKATARILGAAAKIAENHDQLIDEVVEMVEEDLNRQPHAEHFKMDFGLYTVEQLQGQFKTLKDAKAHFNTKVKSWAALVSKLNEPGSSPSLKASKPQDSVSQRLTAIECDIQSIRSDIGQVLIRLNLILEKLP